MDEREKEDNSELIAWILNELDQYDKKMTQKAEIKEVKGGLPNDRQA